MRIKLHGRLAALGILALAPIFFSGCITYIAQIDIDPKGNVVVTERIAIDPVWRAQVSDSMNATVQIIERYRKEAKERGGKVKTFASDSARAVFRYKSLGDFVYNWPDTSENRSRWDRSLHRTYTHDDTTYEELVLFRMSPPDRSKELPNQKYPVLFFSITPPVPASQHNAHRVMGATYQWRFTEDLAEADSVLISWPVNPVTSAASAP